MPTYCRHLFLNILIHNKNHIVLLHRAFISAQIKFFGGFYMDKARIAIRELRVEQEAKEKLQAIAKGMGITLTKLICDILDCYKNSDVNEFLKEYYSSESERYAKLSAQMEEKNNEK